MLLLLFLFLLFDFLLGLEWLRVDLEAFFEASAEPGVRLRVRQRFAPLLVRALWLRLELPRRRLLVKSDL